ncbi:MAG: hypothetical protein O9330_19635 [Beijerinckiaceae bacterium]|jgi:bacterioferritin-associated ferredoxin|nr:hypothetical protein [Beijerinckiaceae bacterium]
MIVCSCNVLSCRQIKATIAPDGTGPRTAGEAYDCLGCSPDCGRCAREVRAILAEARAACMTQCGSCVVREIECSVHIAVGQMMDGLAAENDLAA